MSEQYDLQAPIFGYFQSFFISSLSHITLEPLTNSTERERC
jgi:hypothetical protein